MARKKRFRSKNYYLDTTGIMHNKTSLDKILNYSTEEQIVGKWINGKDVYKRVIYLDAVQPGATQHDIGLKNCTLIRTEGYYFSPLGRFYFLPFKYLTDYIEYVFIEDNILLINSFTGYASNAIYFIVEYTKNN